MDADGHGTARLSSDVAALIGHGGEFVKAIRQRSSVQGERQREVVITLIHSLPVTIPDLINEFMLILSQAVDA